MKENNLFFIALKEIKKINKKAKKIWEVYFNLTSYKSQITKMKLLGIAASYQSINGNFIPSFLTKSCNIKMRKED